MILAWIAGGMAFWFIAGWAVAFAFGRIVGLDEPRGWLYEVDDE